ncbi:MAG: hypothetical protein U9Q07_08550, partial [Planctomycetota bacterium]|nr:hypothetical protein [Planctomycetota bacterium]
GKKAIISSGNIRMEMEKDFASIQKGVIEIWGKRWPGAMKNAENTWEGMMSLILSRWQDFQADVMEAGVFEHLKEGAKVATKMVDEMGITAEDTAQVIKESMKIAIYAIAGVADGAKAAGIAIAWLGKQASWSAGLIAKAMDAASGLGTKLGKALASSDKSTGGQLKSGLNLIEKIFGVNFKSSAEKVKAVVSKTNEDIAENTKLLDEQMAAIWEKGSSWEAVTGFYDRLDARAKKSADVAKKEAEKTSGIYEGVLPEIGGSSDQKSARTAFSMQFEPTAGESKAATEAENYRTAILYLADAAEKALGPIKKIRTIFGDISETAYNLIRTIGGTFPGVMGMMVSSAVLLTRNTKKAKQEVISLGRAFAGVANIITNHVLNAFEELIRSGKLGTQQLRQMLVELGIDIARMMAQMAAQAAIKTAVTYMAEGGVAVGGMSNPQPIPSYAGGTIVRGPHVAVVGDNPEAEEAIIPMKGGKVPVDLKGSGGGGNININITAMDGADVERVLMNNSDKLAAALQKVSAESGAARG